MSAAQADTLERRFFEKLGIEEKHEFLSNLVPLYKRLTLAIIPPLQTSIDYFNGGDSQPESLESRTTSRELLLNEPRATRDSEDFDVAFPIGDEKALTSFLNMLTTALAYAGMDSFKHLRSMIQHGHKLCGPTGGTLVGYTFDSDDEESVASEPDHDESKSWSEGLTSSKLNNMTRTKSESIFRSRPRALRAGSEEPRKLPSNILELVLGDDARKVPLAEERTPWQASLMEKVNLAPANIEALVHPVDDDVQQEAESQEAHNAVAYYLANKLRDAFDLSDDDEFHDRFDAWLIRDVFLRGHIYLTRDAICFYSLLPGIIAESELSDPDLALHSGAVGYKMTHYGDSYFSSVYTHRFWAVLKPQTLSIYNSPTKQYFPVKVVNLHKALYCEIERSTAPLAPPVLSPHLTGDTTPKLPFSPSEMLMSQLDSEASSLMEQEEELEQLLQGVWFKIVCTDKTYRFQTGSIYSARHWYNDITKVIFQLHNTNPQREVLLKVPMVDILDFNTNFVLADTDEIDDLSLDNDTPISFSLKYRLPQQAESRLDKLKMKSKKLENHGESDFVHFFVFKDARKLYELFTEVYQSNVSQNLDLTPVSTNLRTRAKKMFREDILLSTSSGSTKINQTIISTLQPEFAPGMSLIDKVANANEELLRARQIDRYKYEYGEDKEPRPEDLGPKRSGTIKKLKGVASKILTSKSSTDLCDPKCSLRKLSTTSNGGSAPSMQPLLDGVQPLHFPKSFTLMTLKNLNMLIITKKRSFKEVELRYKELAESTPMKDTAIMGLPASISEEDIEGKDMAELANLRKRAGTGTRSSLSTNSGESSTPDLTEVRKRSKMESFKRSIKTVSTMGGVWSANPEHFDDDGTDSPFYVNSPHERDVAVRHFRKHFSLGDNSELIASWYAHLKRGVPVYGKVYLGEDKLCFRSLLPGVSTKMILPLKKMVNCTKSSCAKLHYSGLVIKMRGMEEYFLEFGNAKARDDCQTTILRQLEKEGHTLNPSEVRHSESNKGDSSNDEEEWEYPSKSRSEVLEIAESRVRSARLRLWEDKISAASGIDFPLVFEDNPFTFTEVKPSSSFNITLLTIGSRGDVQPYIALGKGLLKEGHHVTIATHVEFKEWVTKHGLHFKEVAGNPAELMQLMVTHGSMSVGFLKEANANFKGWINELLTTSWEACQGADLLIESPSAMGGIHIAEALGIPYMRAFTMPWTRTRAYPHAFIVPDQKRGGSYNFLTHVMFENVFWKGISGQVNKWRVETLGLARTNLVKLQQSKVPFLYNVSPALFPPSVDFPDWVKVTGYWFLDEGDHDYEPPEDLVRFLETARENGEKVVYVGFGSIVVRDAVMLTKTIVEAVVALGVKCILNKGWSDRLSGSKDGDEVELPPQIYNSGVIPHDWLFPRIDAAVHHGGSGTVGATLRAGLPTVIKPFFGDQFFYASRIEDLGCGISMKNLNTKSFTKALKAVTTDEKYRRTAQAVARSMDHETGVLTAIAEIYSELAYAKSLILSIKLNTELRKHYDDKSGAQTPAVEEEFVYSQNSMVHSSESSDSESDSESDDESMLSEEGT